MNLLQGHRIDLFAATSDVIDWIVANHPDAIAFRAHFFQGDFKGGCVGLVEASFFAGDDVIEVMIEPEVDHLAELDLGCQIGQGYVIAHPMEAAQLAEWVRLHAQATDHVQCVP